MDLAVPVLRKVDCVMLRVGDLDAALAFYGEGLGHRLIWRTAEAAGLAMAQSEAELVLHTKHGPEVDLLVDDVPAAVGRFVAAGGRVVADAFDIAIGRCAVVLDPFGNTLVLLDQSKGKLVTDDAGAVVGVVKG
jgi:predicted enzyme related to lactoylglutathione lyase